METENSCKIDIRQFLKRKPPGQPSNIEKYNDICKRKVFSDLHFDLKQSLGNEGLLDVG